MDIVFYFHFYAHRKHFAPARSLAFYVANMNTTWDKLYETMALCAQKMEAQYGLVKIAGANANMIGYCSTDIGAEQHGPVMDAWRPIFINHFTGCVVSEVCDVTHAKDETQIYECTKDAYEHQQAQKLRDTLNTHIHTSASPAVAKKM